MKEETEIGMSIFNIIIIYNNGILLLSLKSEYTWKQRKISGFALGAPEAEPSLLQGYSNYWYAV